MSVIAVASDGMRCCMAADSQLTASGGGRALIAGKIVQVGPLLIGPDGTLAMGDAFRYHANELSDRLETLPSLGLATETTLPGWHWS